MALTRRALVIAAVVLLIAAAWWLGDPAWLGTYRHGFHGDGWTGGRASFFVPSDQASVTFDVAGHDEFTMQVSISLDGQLVDRFSADANWRTVTLPTGQLATSRRHRRIDLHVARTWGPDRKGIRLRVHPGTGL
jgi:hypothetical protein